MQKLEEKSYASASVYGVSSIKEALPYLVTAVEETKFKLKTGQAGKFYKDIALYLDDLEPLAIATIMLKITFDRVFSTQRGANTVTPMLVALGSALESECKFRWYKKEYPALMNYISTKYFHNACGTRQKEIIASQKFGQRDIKWQPWNIKAKTSIGRWGLMIVMETTQWFTVQKRKTHRKRYDYRVVPTDLFNEKRAELIKSAELFAGIPWPMLVVPDDWGYDNGQIVYGGYLTNSMMKGHDLTRKGNPFIIHGETPMNFLNKLQRVKYCVNQHVLHIADKMRLRGRIIGKFIPISPTTKLPRPVDADENQESNLAWRRAMAEAHNADRINFKRSVRTRTQLEAAEKFKDDVFYLCWSFDYRGRAYPIPAFLTPQDTDFGKALLRFADEASVTDEAELWLSFQVATTCLLYTSPSPRD